MGDTNFLIMTLQKAKKDLQRYICNEGAGGKVYHYCDDSCMYGRECCPISISLDLIDEKIKQIVGEINERKKSKESAET